MERYIEQLIEDLRKARNHDDPPEMMEDLLASQVETAEDQCVENRQAILKINEKFCFSFNLLWRNHASEFGLVKCRPQMAGATI